MSKKDSSHGPLDYVILAGLILLAIITAAAVLTGNNLFLN